MKLSKIISAYKNKFFPKKLELVDAVLMGKTLRVYEDTVPKQIDKDDAWFYALSRHHNIIYDIGANIGFCSLIACMHNAAKKIVLIDPNEQVLKYAEQNMALNGMSENKTFICCFVGDTPGEMIKFYTLGTGAAGSMFATHAVSAKAVNSWSWVASKTIDEIVLETGETPDLIKIDVEAAEVKTMNGAKELSKKQVTKFFVEMHAPPEMPMQRNAELILKWCNENNYKAYYLRDHCELKSAAMISDRGRCHLLLLPLKTDYPDYLKAIKENAQLPIIFNN